MTIGSLLLLLPFVEKKLLGLILALISVTVALFIRNQYYKAIFANLSDHALHVHKSILDWLSQFHKKEKKLIDNQLIEFLSSKEEASQKLAIEAIFQSNNPSLLKKAFLHSQNLLPGAKIYLLQLIESNDAHTEPFVLEAINKWQETTEQTELQAWIDIFFAKAGLLHPEKAYLYLSSPHLLQRAAGIIALQHSFARQSSQNMTANRAAALEQIQYLLDSTNEEEIALGISLLGFEGTQQNIEILVDYLKHPSLKIAKSAAIALKSCVDSTSMRYSGAILDAIGKWQDSDFRQACFQALSQIGHPALVRPMIATSPLLRPNETRLLEKIISGLGLKTVPALVGILGDTSLPDRSRIIAGKILAQLSLPQLNAHLYDVIKIEIERAYFYFYYAHTLPHIYEGHDLSLLKEGLLSSFQSAIDFIIQLLGASKWLEDCELIAFSLRSKRAKIRSQGIESLELCCEHRVFSLLYPLIGDLPLKEKLNFCLQYAPIGMTIAEVLERMEQTSNSLDAIMAATWKYRLNLPNWRTSLRKKMASQKEIFHHFAYELLEA
jgi:hypothetical protein